MCCHYQTNNKNQINKLITKTHHSTLFRNHPHKIWWKNLSIKFLILLQATKCFIGVLVYLGKIIHKGFSIFKQNANCICVLVLCVLVELSELGELRFKDKAARQVKQFIRGFSILKQNANFCFSFVYRTNPRGGRRGTDSQNFHSYFRTDKQLEKVKRTSKHDQLLR